MAINHDEDFQIYTDVSDLPMNNYPSYVEEGMGGICLDGSALLDVFSFKTEIRKNNVIVILPYQLVSINEISDDFQIKFFKVSKGIYREALTILWRMTADFFFYMREHAVYEVSEYEASKFLSYCDFLMLRANRPAPTVAYKRENILQVLRIFYWDLYVSYKRNAQINKNIKYSRKEEISYNFFTLLVEYYREKSDVASYADLLCVSSKYLTMTVKETTGFSAKYWIDNYTILEIKAMLRDCSLDIKEVLAYTRFSTQSLVSRFFRKHTGMSPTEYRESIYI